MLNVLMPAILVLSLSLLTTMTPSQAAALQVTNSVPTPSISDMSPSQRKEAVSLLVEHYGDKHGLSQTSENQMLATIQCESGGTFNPTAVGDYGTSFGLTQIHLPAHPNISKAEAENPDFAINWMAIQFSEGNKGIWSCWNKLYG